MARPRPDPRSSRAGGAIPFLSLAAIALGPMAWAATGDAPARSPRTIAASAPQESPAPLDGPSLPADVFQRPFPVPATAPDAPQEILAGWAGMHQEYSFDGCPTGCPVHDRVPDPHGGVGPASIVAITNRRIACHDKSGTLLWGPVQFADFWPSPGPFVFDPRVIYDRDTGRFFAVCLDSRPTLSFLNLAVSKSSSPASSTTSDWWFYQIDVTESHAGSLYGGDYPCIGTDSRALYVGLNMGLLPLGSGGILNCQVVVFKKSDVVAGVLTPATTSRHLTPPTGVANSFTLQHAKVVTGAGPGNVAYFAEVPRYECDFLRLWAITDPIGTPNLVGPAVVPVPCNGGVPMEANGTDIAFARQCDISTREGSLTPLAPRAMDAVWVDGAVWLCHTAGGGAEPLRSIVYYYEILPNDYPSGTPTLGLVGDFDGGGAEPYGIWSYMPALGANAHGDLCIAFTRSSFGYPICPSILVAVREAGQMDFGPAWPVKTSPNSTAVDLSRWGDYGVVAPDPEDDSFWICHEWAPSTATRDWGTWWANIAATNPTDAADPPAPGALVLESPNPFSRSARVRYSVAREEHVALEVFDVAGRRVATLVDRLESPGYRSVSFEPSGLPNGVYLCRLRTETATTMRRLVLAR